MKKLIPLIFLFASFSAFSQTGNDTTKYTYSKFTYGYRLDRLWGNQVVDIPNDTVYSKYGLARKGTLLYVGNGSVWTSTGGTGASYTADETTVHLNGSNIFSIKSSYVGQTSITQLGTITNGVWNATSIADTYISSAATWNAKIGSTLNSAQIFVGNASNVATPVSVSGDFTLTNAGVAALVNTAVVPASYTNANITVDSKGRITAAANGTGGGGSTPFPDNSALIEANGDHTKLLILNASSITPSTTRTLTSPDASGVIDLQNNVATLTNKTIVASSNTITGLTNSNLSGSAGIVNANLANSAITVNGVSVSLGGSTSVTDATLSTSNISTNNVSTSKHGFVPILPNDATKYLDGTGAFSVPGAGGSSVAIDATQTYTTGSTLTVTSGNNIVYINPSSVQSALTITLPSSWHNSNTVYIIFGGTITSGNPVITSFSVVAGSGQTLVQTAAPVGTWNSGEVIEYKLNGSFDNRIL